MKEQHLRKYLLYGITFLVYGVTAANYIHALSRFLEQLGPALLPYQFVVVSLLIIITSLGSSFLSMRMTSDKIFSGTLAFFLLNYAILFFLPEASTAHVFYFLAIATFMLFLEEISVMHFLNSLMTPLQAKQQLPVVLGFSHLGWIVGALLAIPYTHFHEYLGIGTLPIFALCGILMLVMLSSKVFHREIKENFEDVEKVPFFKSIGQAFHYVRKESHLYRWLAFIVFLVVGIQLTLEFKLKTSVANAFDHEQLTETLALIFMAKSIIVWFFSTFLVKRVLFYAGVSNTLMLYPASVLGALFIASLFWLHHLAIIGLFIIFSLSHTATYGIVMDQILSVVPRKLQQSVYFLIRGLVFAVGLLIFSLSLLVYSYNISWEPTLNTLVIAGLCALAIYASWQVKDLYFKDLKQNLFKEDRFLQLRSIDLLAEKPSILQGEQQLRRLLHMPELELDTQSRVMTSLGTIGNYQTIIDLAKILTHDYPPKVKSQAIHAISQIIRDKNVLNRYPVTKHYLLEAYEELLLSDVPHELKLEIVSALKYFDLEDVIEFLENHLVSDNPHMVANTIRTFAEFGDRGIIAYIEPFLEHKDLEIVSEAIVALWQFKEMRVHLLPRVTILVLKEGKQNIKHTLYVIGSLPATWERDYVVTKLHHPDRQIQRYALFTLIRLGDKVHIDKFLDILLDLARKDHRSELDEVLVWYRSLESSVQEIMIRKMQQAKPEEAAIFRQSFSQSRYVFSQEIAALT